MANELPRTALLDLRANSWQFDEHNVAQTRLGVVCNRNCAHRCAVIENDSFVVLRILLGCKARNK